MSRSLHISMSLLFCGGFLGCVQSNESKTLKNNQCAAVGTTASGQTANTCLSESDVQQMVNQAVNQAVLNANNGNGNGGLDIELTRICHNPSSMNEIPKSASGGKLDAHLRHGDRIGQCDFEIVQNKGDPGDMGPMGPGGPEGPPGLNGEDGRDLENLCFNHDDSEYRNPNRPGDLICCMYEMNQSEVTAVWQREVEDPQTGLLVKVNEQMYVDFPDNFTLDNQDNPIPGTEKGVFWQDCLSFCDKRSMSIVTTDILNDACHAGATLPDEMWLSNDEGRVNPRRTHFARPNAIDESGGPCNGLTYCQAVSDDAPYECRKTTDFATWMKLSDYKPHACVCANRP